jgi:hypothetical protein
MLGEILLANEKTALTYFSPSLNHLDIDMLMRLAPASVATAFASMVFPVPEGPNKRIPLQGCVEKYRSRLIRKPPIHNVNI